jgi:hypothetical protein
MSIFVAGIEISSDALNLLSDDERESLDRLFAPTPTRKSNLEKYNLIYTTNCKVCGHSTRQLFRMQQSEDGLQSTEVAKFEDLTLSVKTAHKDFYTCSHCFEYFMNKPKEELVNLLLRRVR